MGKGLREIKGRNRARGDVATKAASALFVAEADSRFWGSDGGVVLVGLASSWRREQLAPGGQENKMKKRKNLPVYFQFIVFNRTPLFIHVLVKPCTLSIVSRQRV